MQKYIEIGGVDLNPLFNQTSQVTLDSAPERSRSATQKQASPSSP
jgi:hypothetical protein